MATVTHANTDWNFSLRALSVPGRDARRSRSFVATGRRLNRIAQLGRVANVGFTPTTRVLVRQAVRIYRFGWSWALPATHPLPGESS